MNKVMFSISLIFFWLKGEVEVDSRFVKTNLANTILGIVPAGRDQQSIPLKNISGSMLSTKYRFKPMLVGFFVALFGFSAMANSFLTGLIVFVFGVCIVLSSVQTTLRIEKSGTPYEIQVPFFEKSKMQVLNGLIQNALAADTDKTDLNLFFDQKERPVQETV